MATFDVLDKEGTFVRQVALQGPWNSQQDGVFVLSGDHAIVITGYAAAMPAQFTRGKLSAELAGEAASMEVVFCRALSAR